MRTLAWVLAASIFIAGTATEATSATKIKAADLPDIQVSFQPKTSSGSFHRLYEGSCNRLRIMVRNNSAVGTAGPVIIEAYIGKRFGAGYRYYTGAYYKKLITLQGGSWGALQIDNFKITKALIGKNAYVVVHADRAGRLREGNEQNNQFGVPVENLSNLPNNLNDIQRCP
jgi:hypothetical protein